MKRKFIALLLSMVSVTSLFAACKEEPPVVDPCTTHVDTDKNAVCDACGKDIIYIKDQIVKDSEEAVDMVVNPIPAEAVRNDYLKDEVAVEDVLPTTKEKFDIWSVEDEDVKIENLQVSMSYGNLFKISYTAVEWNNTDPENPVEVKSTNYKVLYDAVNNKELYRFESKTYVVIHNEGTAYEYEYEYTDDAYIHVLPYGGIYEIIETRYSQSEYDNSYNSTTTYSCYTFAGEKLCSELEEPTISYADIGDYIKIWINDTVYAIDSETYAVLHSCHKDVFVNRPRFDVVQGNYGYVYSSGGVYVYDLTKWIDCVYADQNIEGTTCVLANGNVLVQSEEKLSDSAVSYDVIKDNTKYDLVQTIINPVEGTATEVEFGYYINEYVSGASEEGAEYLVSAENNAFMVTPIEGRMYSNKQLLLVTDSDLNVLYGEEWKEITKVGDDLYLKNIYFGDGSEVEATVNGKDELITYLPGTYDGYNGFIVVDDTRIYNWKMELLLDLAKEEYNRIGIMDNTAMILSKTVEEDDTTTTDILDDKIFVTYYYYYNPSVNATPVQLGSKTDDTTVAYYSINSYGGYFNMSKTVETEEAGVPTTVTTYLVYNANNALIGEFEEPVYSVNEIGDSGVYYVVNNGEYFFIK